MALLILAPGTTIAADDPYYGGFDGRWEGMLRYIPAEAYDSEHGYAPENARFAFSIKGETVSVYINKNPNSRPQNQRRDFWKSLQC
jgi:hypothetical protein